MLSAPDCKMQEYWYCAIVISNTAKKRRKLIVLIDLITTHCHPPKRHWGIDDQSRAWAGIRSFEQRKDMNAFNRATNTIEFFVLNFEHPRNGSH